MKFGVAFANVGPFIQPEEAAFLARSTEEACAALRTLWKPGAHAFKSDHYAWEALESNPKPVQPGGVPIIVGGHVLGAARRAARVGDGFFPMKTGGARLRELLAALSDE